MRIIKKFSSILLFLIFLSSCRSTINKEYPIINSGGTQSGDPNSDEDAGEWDMWLTTFERHGITAKNLSFGFDIKQPKRRDEDFEYNDNVVGKMSDSRFQTLYEVYQLSKQFKYIDKETKIIFVRNRIPKTLIKSQVKPKCVLVTLGGGYYTSGTENLKRFLDSLPKMLYYNDHRPSSYEWGENIIMKLWAVANL